MHSVKAYGVFGGGVRAIRSVPVTIQEQILVAAGIGGLGIGKGCL